MRQALVGVALGLVAGGFVGFAVGSSRPPDRIVVAPPSAPPAPEAAELPASTQEPAPARPQRTHVAPPPRRTASSRAEEAPAEAEPAAPSRPAGEILAEVAAALRSEQPLDWDEVRLAQALAATGWQVPVDLSLVDLALGRTDDPDVVFALSHAIARCVDPADAYAALVGALAGDRPERLTVAPSLAVPAAASGLDLLSLGRSLLAHADPGVRAAGLQILSSHEATPVDDLLAVSQRDADPQVRADALWLLLGSIDWENPDVYAREAVTPVVLLAAREGRGQLRRSAIDWLAEIGAPAADTALAILREGGLDEEAAWGVVAPILAARRPADLLAAHPSEVVLLAAAQWLESAELEPEAWRTMMPLVRASLPIDRDLGESLLWSLAAAGLVDELRSLAQDRHLAPPLRAAVIGHLLDLDVEDAGRAAASERAAVEILRQLADPAKEAVDVRFHAVRAVWTWGATVDDPTARAELEVLLRRAAAGDPSSWVRDAAEESLELLAEQ